MEKSTVLLFTRNGMGHGPAELQTTLVDKFLTLTLQSGELPDKILFITESVKLVCEGSSVLSLLDEFAAKGVEMIICKTCLDSYGLAEKVQTGIIGGMPDILEVLQEADKVISL